MRRVKATLRTDNAPCLVQTFHKPGAAARNIKGAVGQALVAKYFEFAGWSVQPTGLEAVIDHIMHRLDFKRGQTGDIPDLVVSQLAGSPVSPSTHPLGQSFYVEVKTRKRWPMTGMDVSQYLKFGKVLLVWVGPLGVKGAWVSDSGGQVVHESDFKSIEHVGQVSLQHCTDDSCEAKLRAEFNRLSKELATLEVDEG